MHLSRQRYPKSQTPVALLTLVAFLSAMVGPFGTARAATPEDAKAVESPNFCDSTNHVTGGPSAQAVSLRQTFEHRTGAEWQLGMPTRQTRRGYSETFAGGPDLDRVLSDVAFEYVPQGAPRTVTRVGITPEGCPGPADAVTTFDYMPLGLVQSVHESTRTVSHDYDSTGLHPIRQTVTAGAMRLSVEHETDLRTGLATRRTDPSGLTEAVVRDSRGRPLERSGAAGLVLERHVYNDGPAPSIASTVWTDVGVSILRKTHLDGSGAVVAGVDGLGTREVPFVRTARVRRDAFGREVESFLPREVPSLDSLGLEGPKTVTIFDGMDRPTRVTEPDGTETSFRYEARATLEINARGVVKRAVFDAFGKLIALHRDVGGSDASSVHFARDGLGGLVRLVDGDLRERRVERDGGGRVHRMDLPHALGVTPAGFQQCHDVDRDGGHRGRLVDD